MNNNKPNLDLALERASFIKHIREAFDIADYIPDETIMASQGNELRFEGWLSARRAGLKQATGNSDDLQASTTSDVLPSVLIPCAFRVPSEVASSGVRIEEVPRPDGPPRWAARYQGLCLNKQGEWEYEPMPSSRDDAFYAQCRFDSPSEVLTLLVAKSTAGN